MPFTEGYPFERLGVTQASQFVTRVWWKLQAGVAVPDDTPYQLQWGRTDNVNAGDWTNIGDPVTDECFIDVEHGKLPAGMDPDLFFRVVLQGASCDYMSQPIPIHGELDDHQWALAREIVRKERLRLTKLGHTGVILQRRHRGTKCTACIDTPTGLPTNSRCPECFGTGIQGGYYPPTPVTCFELSPAKIPTQRGEARPPGQNQYLNYTGRFVAAPRVGFEDVVVDLSSGLRYFAHNVEVAADLRGVRLVLVVELRQADLADVVYRIPIGGEPADHALSQLSQVGTGCVVVDHNYQATDALTYVDENGCGITGASVLAFTAADYANGMISDDYVVARTLTTANGRWEAALLLDPGDYVFVLEKPGFSGPDAVALTVTAPVEPEHDFGDPGPPPLPTPPLGTVNKTQPEDPPWRTTQFGVY